MHLSIVIPAYNEGSKIIADLEAGVAYLKGKGPSELLIVNDGSSDDTADRVRGFLEQYAETAPQIRLIDLKENRGKGHAVRQGILEARGDAVAFVDSGLCVPFAHLDRGLAALEKGADFAIASRRHSQSEIKRIQPFHRRIGSRIFGGLVRSLMGVRFVNDTQCGFKIYSARAAQAIFQNVLTDGFMFDVEALLVGRALGLKVAEFPVAWSNDSDTRYDPIWGTVRNFGELCRIRWRALSLSKSQERITAHAR